LLPGLLSVLGSIFVAEFPRYPFRAGHRNALWHLCFAGGGKQWPGLEFGEMEERSPKGLGAGWGWAEEHGEPLPPEVFDFAKLRGLSVTSQLAKTQRYYVKFLLTLTS
jgi:hypothetical protein